MAEKQMKSNVQSLRVLQNEENNLLLKVFDRHGHKIPTDCIQIAVYFHIKFVSFLDGADFFVCRVVFNLPLEAFQAI